MSRVWLIEALARKRGVNELAAYLRMLGDHRTCSLLYPLSRLTYRNQKLPHSKRQIADLEPVPPADQVRPVSPRQHRGTFGRKHLPRRTHLPTLRGRTPALPAGHTCPERTPALPKDIGTMWRAVPPLRYGTLRGARGYWAGTVCGAAQVSGGPTLQVHCAGELTRRAAAGLVLVLAGVMQ